MGLAWSGRTLAVCFYGKWAERKARPEVYAGQSARRAWAVEAARLGKGSAGRFVSVFIATNMTALERAGRNIIASIGRGTTDYHC